MAIGVLATLRQRNISVPEDMSVMGFDDMPIAQDVLPPLSTVRLGMPEMGMRAMALALGPPALEARVEHLPAELVRRASVAAPPR
jgi:LacI family transcriptional regulator